jgi:hypothetical protein
MFSSKLQIRDGAIHHWVLFRTSPCLEPCRGSAISSLPGNSRIGSRNNQPAAAGGEGLAYEAADSSLLSSELAAGIRRVKGVKELGARAGKAGWK